MKPKMYPMEEIKPPYLKATMGYGLMIAIVMIVYSLILYILDMDKNQGLNYLSYLILFVGILIVSINFRNKYLEGAILYGQAFKVGFLSSVFVGVIMAVWTYIFFTFVDPGAMQEIIVAAEEGMVERGMSDQDIDVAMTWVEKMQRPWIYSIWAILGMTIVGLILSLITSIFVKRDAHPDVNGN